MKRKKALIGAAAVAAASLAGCGGNSSGSASVPPPAVLPTQLDTAQVLVVAQSTSEVASPLAVNDGAVMFTDTSDSSEAVNINGM
jgi:hypothetical protein